MKPSKEKYEGKVSIELDRNGLIQIKDVSMSEECKYQEKVAKKKEQKKDEKKDEKSEQKMEIEEEFELVEKTRIETKNL